MKIKKEKSVINLSREERKFLASLIETHLIRLYSLNRKFQKKEIIRNDLEIGEKIKNKIITLST